MPVSPASPIETPLGDIEGFLQACIQTMPPDPEPEGPASRFAGLGLVGRFIGMPLTRFQKPPCALAVVVRAWVGVLHASV